MNDYYSDYGMMLQNKIRKIHSYDNIVFEENFVKGYKEENWVFQNIVAKKASNGLLEITPDNTTYGTMFLKQELPANCVIEFSFMFSDGCLHDMDFIFPTHIASEECLSSKSEQTYIWGINGWGGRITGVEKTKTPGILAGTELFIPVPGVLYHVLFFYSEQEQILLIDNKAYLLYSDPNPLGRENGFFGFSAFETKLKLLNLVVRSA